MAHQKRLLDIFTAAMHQGANFQQRKMLEELAHEMMMERQGARQDLIADTQAQRDVAIAARQRDRDAAIHARMLEQQERANKDAQSNAFLDYWLKGKAAKRGHEYDTEIENIRAESRRQGGVDDRGMSEADWKRLLDAAPKVLSKERVLEMQARGEFGPFMDDVVEHKKQGLNLVDALTAAATQNSIERRRCCHISLNATASFCLI